jgi:hypothetical protein
MSALSPMRSSSRRITSHKLTSRYQSGQLPRSPSLVTTGFPTRRCSSAWVSSLGCARDVIKFLSVQTFGGDNHGEMASRGDESSDVTVLEHDGVIFAPDTAHRDIHHGPSQVVSANHLVGEQHSKQRIQRAEQAVAEIRFLPRLHGIDVRGPEEVNARKPRRK